MAAGRRGGVAARDRTSCFAGRESIREPDPGRAQTQAAWWRRNGPQRGPHRTPCWRRSAIRGRGRDRAGSRRRCCSSTAAPPSRLASWAVSLLIVLLAPPVQPTSVCAARRRERRPPRLRPRPVGRRLRRPPREAAGRRCRRRGRGCSPSLELPAPLRRRLPPSAVSRPAAPAPRPRLSLPRRAGLSPPPAARASRAAGRRRGARPRRRLGHVRGRSIRTEPTRAARPASSGTGRRRRRRAGGLRDEACAARRRQSPLRRPRASLPLPPNHFSLALYYQRIADYDNALVHYRALLEQNDASAEVHNNLGLLYQDQGQLDEAVSAVPARDRHRSEVRQGAQQSRRRVHAPEPRPTTPPPSSASRWPPSRATSSRS